MTKELIFPPSLNPGDTLRIIAPASAPKSWEKLQPSLNAFKHLGFNITLSKNLRSKKDYLAGSDSERLKDLHDAFRDKSVKGIICLRGGYGTPRLLNQIDYSLIRRNPKILCGFSDITALHMAIYTKSKVSSFLGPNLFSFLSLDTFSDLSIRSFLSIAMSKDKDNVDLLGCLDSSNRKKIKVINPGAINGWAIGGNLSLICSLIGTEYFPSLNGCILFIEEVNEPAYRIDRMLTQLLLSGVLNKVNAFVIGRCSGCDDYEKVFIERLKPLKKPMIIRVPFGHIDDMITIPIGRRVKIKT
jgi:muramoyltetrapeptide carboxypeptidase